MSTRRLAPLLIALLLLGLMAGALLLALDGESPSALLPGGDDRAAATGGDPSAGDAGAPDAAAARRGRRAAHITGDVRVLRTRAAAPGRVVTLTLADGGIRQVVTDGQGGFAFGDVPPDAPHELRIDGEDHAPVVRPGLFLRAGERLDVGTLWLADGVRVAFEVRSFDGQALAGATVRAFAQGPGSPAFDTPRDPAPVAVSTTEADGVAHFAGLPPGTWTFTAERGGYARRGLVGAVVREGVPEERFRLALERGYRLSGRVLDARGEPVPGAPVLAIRRTLPSDATTAPLALRTTTDRDGRFVFGALPAADVVLWSGWPGGRLAVLAAVRLPGVDAIDLVLLRGGRLEGRVTRADDGQPIDGARVSVSLQVLGSFVLAFELETDHDGHYALDLPMPGTLSEVSAEHLGYRAAFSESGEIGSVLPTGALVTVDLAMERGGVVKGRVTGPDGPLAGATAAATNSGWYFTATTDREGRFVLNGLPSERFFVMASLWGHVMPGLPDDPDGALARGTAPERYVVDLSAAGEAEVEIELVPGGTLRGRVETHDGAPAAGAVVSPSGTVIAAHAADDGTFALGPLEPAALSVQAVAADGGARATVVVEVPPPPATPEPVTIRLGPEARVRGRLTSETGTALHGAYVQVVPWNGSLDDPVTDEWSWLQAPRLPVDADGTFDHAIDGSMETFVLRAGALGHRRASSGRLSVGPSQPEVRVDLVLSPGETFTGRVVNLDGEPVRGAWVSAVPVAEGTDPFSVGYPGAWGPPVVAVTDEDGAFRIPGLDAGPHAVRAWAESHVPDARIVDVPGDSGATFEIVASLSIEGAVAYEDGAPVVGARVSAMHQDGAGYGEGRTDSDGRFHVPGLSPGTYRVEAAPAGDGRQNMVPGAVDGVDAGAVDVRISVERGRTVSGRVTDASGAPVEGAQIQALQDESATAQTGTDAAGTFLVRGLRAGRVRITVDCDALLGTGTVEHEVQAGEEGVEIRLPATAEIEGVLVGPDGAPLAGQSLFFRPRDESGPRGITAWPRSAQTGGDGAFSTPAAPGAAYDVLLTEHPELTLAPGTTLRAGDTGARLVATPGESIAGRVVDDAGNGVAGVDVQASDDDVSRSATSAADGSFELHGLHGGQTYSLWAGGAGWATRGSQDVRAPATSVSLRVQRLTRLSGHVHDADGSALSEAMVQIVDADGNSWAVWTDQDGAFAIDALPEGRYGIRVDRHGNGEPVECGSVETGRGDVEVRYPGR